MKNEKREARGLQKIEVSAITIDGMTNWLEESIHRVFLRTTVWYCAERSAFQKKIFENLSCSNVKISLRSS